MTLKRTDIAEVLRQRILGLVRAGALAHGDRLPSCRQLATEFDADPRVIQGAYRLLAQKGLVEQRPRSGVFLRHRKNALDKPGVSAIWVAEVLAGAIGRDIGGPQFLDVLRRALTSRTVRVVTVAKTRDQNEGMCRELRDDYGLQASCVNISAINSGAPWPKTLVEAELLVTTAAHEPHVRPVANELGIPMIVGALRQDLVGTAWRRLLRSAVYVVVADREFIPVVRAYFSRVPGSGNIHYLVAGEDDTAHISPIAPVYITSAARDVLGVQNIPGRPLPPARVFATETTRQILRFVVARQLSTALEAANEALPSGNRSTRRAARRPASVQSAVRSAV